MGVLTGNLNISTLKLTGDPTIYNATGDIVINSSLQFPGQDLAIIAAGNVLSTQNANGGGPIIIDTSGGNLLIASGAQLKISGNSRPELPPGHNSSGDPPVPAINTFYADGFVTKVLPDGTTFREPHQFSTTSQSTVLTIYGGNDKPGKIDLQNVALVSTSANGLDSGSIKLIAFGGGINAPNTIFNTSASSATVKAGDVEVIANGAISLGQINASGGVPGYQTTIIVSAQPYAFDVKWQGNNVALGTQNVVIQDGKILFGGFSEFSDFSASPTITNSNITLADVSSTGGDNTITLPNFFHSALGGSIWIQTNGDISTGKLSASSVGTSSASEGGHIEITSAGHVLTKSINLVSSPNFTGNSSLTLNLSGPGEFVVGSPTNHGIDGTVNADVVQIFSQNGDVNVPNPAAISNGHTTVDLIANNIKIGAGTLSADAYSGDYSAGTIFFNATNSLSIAANLTANGAGANSKGGSIYLYAPEILLAGSRTIAASGSGAGSGGNITVGGLSNLSMGGTTNLLASGGLAGGSGGRIRVDQFSAYQITDSGSSLNMLANGNGAGSGGRVQISSADVITISNANIYADASSLGSGDGGTARMQAASFVLQKSSVALHADGGQSGNGGNIFVASTDANANLQLDNNFLVSANSGKSAGSGGSINISSGHDLKIKTSAVNAAVLGSQGNGGNITATAASAGLGGTLSLSGNLSVDGKGSGNGGNVSLTAAKMEFPDSTARLISANGGSTGNGGYIEITASDPAAGISLGNNSGAIRLSATGGSLNSSAGDGGTIHVRTGGDLTVRPQNVNVASRGSQGNGCNIQLIAGFQGSSYDSSGNEIFQFNDKGTLTLLPGGTLNASANGAGTGGSINLQGALVNVDSNLNVNGGQSGNGGQINVSAHGAGNIVSISGTKNITALGGTASGSGGSISVSSDAGVSVSGGSINASARGAGSGGTVTIAAGKAAAGDLNLAANVRADAGTVGTGGTIKLASITGNVNITQNPNASHTDIFARGGSISGDGGYITLPSAGVLSVDGANINASARANGNGGTITLTSGDTTAASMILPSAAMRADAAGTGNGGTINITSAGDINPGAPGTTTITARGGDSSGNGGNLTVTAAGNMTMGSGLADMSARGAGSGGTVNLTATNGNLNSVADLKAEGGQGQNNGGTITLAANSGNLTVGDPSTQGTLALSTVARGNGDGGAIKLTSSGDITVYGNTDSSAKNNGNAGDITVQLQSGTININGSVNADAFGIGAGGVISLGGPDAPNQTNRVTKPITAFSKLGNAGKIFISSENADWTTGDIDLSTRGKDAIAGQLIIRVGHNIATGSINVSSIAGIVGAVYIQANTTAGSTDITDNFVVGGQGHNNGVNGLINASGNSTIGFQTPGTDRFISGSFVGLENDGTGGITISSANPIHTAITGVGKGLIISLNAANGTIMLPSSFTNNASGLGHAAGNIAINASTISLTGDSQISAKGSDLASGGTILVGASRIQYGSSLTLNTVGSISGDIKIVSAGNVTIALNPPASVSGQYVVSIASNSIQLQKTNLTITGNGELKLIADSNGQAGKIDVRAGNILTVSNNNSNISFSASGTGLNVPGSESISLIADKFDLTNAGNLSIKADGSGAGKGGSIIVQGINSPVSDLSVGSGFHQIQASAQGGVSGGGGSIEVSVGRNLTVDSQFLSVNAGNDGNGGNLSLGAGLQNFAGKLTIHGDLQTNSTRDGGTIILKASNFGFDPDTVISANGGSRGGSVSIVSISGRDLVLGNFLHVEAHGITAGGNILVETAGNFRLTNSAVLDVTPAEVGGAVGTITIGAALETESDVVLLPLAAQINGQVLTSTNANGVTTRGAITFVGSSETITGSGRLDGLISAAGSTISLTNSGAALFLDTVKATAGDVKIDSKFSVNGVSRLSLPPNISATGQITLISQTSKIAPITVDSTRIQATAGGAINIMSLRNSGPVELLNSSSGGSFAFSALTGSLIHNVTGRSVTILNQLSGRISIGDSSTIQSNNAGILIANIPGTGITIGNGVNIITPTGGAIVVRNGPSNTPTTDVNLPTNSLIPGASVYSSTALGPAFTVAMGNPAGIIAQGGDIIAATAGRLTMFSTSTGGISLGTGTTIKTGSAPLTIFPPIAFEELLLVKNSLRVANLSNCVIHTTRNTSIEAVGEGELYLDHGEVIVSARKNTIIEMSIGRVEIRRGADVQIELNNGCLKVRTLFDRHVGSVSLLVEGGRIPVQIGREAVYRTKQSNAFADGVARRGLKQLSLGNYVCDISEISIVSLFGENELLMSVKKASQGLQVALLRRILKSVACLSFVTMTKGPYIQGNPLPAAPGPKRTLI